MEINEVKKIVIAKPVPSRPSPSTFRTFSELLANAINTSPVKESPVTLFKPKTWRFKPHIPPETKVSEAAICEPPGKSELVYSPRPITKLDSSKTVPVLANPTQGLKAKESSNPALENLDEAHKSSYDGYNWRKYGQKQVKGSEYPRSYYKCTHPNCPIKKKVERTLDDNKVLEVVYKGEHNHSKPESFRRGGSSLNRQNEIGSSAHSSSARLGDEHVMVGDCDEVSNRGAHGKRRRNPNHIYEAEPSKESTKEPRIIVQNHSDSGILGDGFHWRKYGQKVVKGNSYPRSYYRCTTAKCNVRKYVERTCDDDSKAFITTYEGRHNHDMPDQKH